MVRLGAAWFGKSMGADGPFLSKGYDMELYERSEFVDAAVSKMLSLLVSQTRGNLILWETVEKTIGFERYTLHWPAFWHRLRRDFLKQTGIALWAVRDVGVRLLTTQDQIIWRADVRRKKAFRQLGRDQKELVAIKDVDLTEHQRILKTRQIQATKEMRRSIRRQVALSEAMSRPSASGLPRPLMKQVA